MIRSIACALFAATLLTMLTTKSNAAPAAPPPPPPTVVVAEGVEFKPTDSKGWKVVGQDNSYASSTLGGMWAAQGGLLGAPVDSVGSVATQTVQIPVAAKYRVWSKYQAPPYYNYLHQVDVIQDGKKVFTHVYGKCGTPRLWSFSGVSDELWWPWGMDHDTAEAPTEMVDLAAGPAELRLTTVANPAPAGDRFINFLVLTTEPKDTYTGFKPYGVGSPFCLEALSQTQLYMRFENSGTVPSKLTIKREVGHFQPNYGGAAEMIPAAHVAAGQWSEWVNIGPFLRLVSDEGILLNLPGASTIAVQFAHDPAGKDLIADLKVPNGQTVVIPIDITWNKASKIMTTEAHAQRLIELAKTKWRTTNGGKKPQQLAYYGAFSGNNPAVIALKDALGYNTQLPDSYDHLKVDGYYCHTTSLNKVIAFAKSLKNPQDFHILSLGDEISLGEINYADPAEAERFRKWLADKGVTAAQLGSDPAKAIPSKNGDSHLAWYSLLFNQDERFSVYREMTDTAKKLIGSQVLVGANYSPHSLALYYGPVYQWVDIFKQGGMNVFWAEDYIFQVPELPQIFSWSLAEARCGAKYHNTALHYYVMPHAPSQTPSFLRRNMVTAIGNGCIDVDSFWVAPQELFTENFISWGYEDNFRVIHESIYDSGEAEKYQVGGKVRPARVAIVLSKATDENEARVQAPKEQDPFLSRCLNAPAKVDQIICRKDQQMIYLALKQAGQAVDLITEDDIAEDGILKNYDVVYFAGEWIDNRTIKPLEEWVKNGGVLYATAGAGHLNQFNEPEPAMAGLLGLKDESAVTKNLYVVRTLLELPLAPAIDTITLDGQKIEAIGLKQVLKPDAAKVLGTWADGSAAVTVNELGKGKVFTVGTLAGNTYMKTGLPKSPWARGGEHTNFNPTHWDPAATKLLRLGIEAGKVTPPVVTSNPLVEALIIDNEKGSLVTLVNWTNEPIKDLKVTVKLPWAPKAAHSVQEQKSLDVSYANGEATFTTNLEYGNYITLDK